jgi:predicted N-acyltransferase
MHVEKLGNEKEWQDFVQATPTATFYHTLEWKRVIQKTFGFVPTYLTVKAQERIVGVCPGFITTPWKFRIYASLPSSDYGGPIFSGTYLSEGTRFLRDFLTEYCLDKEISYVKICFQGSVPKPFLEMPFTFMDQSKGIAEIDLKDTPSEFIWQNTKGWIRQKIRRFEKDGFTVGETSSNSGLKEFYSLYHDNMTHIRAPAYPYEFFENMRNIIPSEEFRVWLVNGKSILGGTACFVFGNRLYLVYGAINRDLSSARHPIIPCICWNLIRWAEEHGIRYVSMGSTPSNPMHRYYVQKARFGAKFNHQVTAFIPFSSNARALMLMRGKAVSAWKAVRRVLPADLKTSLERRFFAL